MTTLTIYITGGGKRAYRFCSTISNTGLLSISNVCGDLDFQVRATSVCDRLLSLIEL